jgi:hypothetical protein
MRKQIYLALAGKLKNSGLAKHVDLWNRNVEFAELEQAWDTPAVFIEFAPIQWRQLGNAVQDANCTFRLHIVTRCVAPSNCDDGNYYLMDAVEYFDLLDSITNLLHRFAGENFGPFIRTESYTNHNHEELVESIEVYTGHITDKSAMPAQGTPVNLALKISANPDLGA